MTCWWIWEHYLHHLSQYPYNYVKHTTTSFIKLSGQNKENVLLVAQARGAVTQSYSASNLFKFKNILYKHSGYSGEIKEGDKVCYSCYRAHLSILQNEKAVSIDKELKELILNLRQNNLSASKNRHRRIDFRDNEESNCGYAVRKYGMLLYRAGSDLTKPLSQALWKQRQQNTNTHSPPTNQARQEVLRDFNLRARQHISHFLKNHDKHTFQIANTLQQLFCWWNWPHSIQILTMSLCQQQKKPIPHPFLPRLLTFDLYRGFSLSVQWCFVVNSHYNIPLHTPLTSIIDGQGGTETLIKILNCLGILCCSMDTLKWHVQYWHSRREESVAQNLETDGFAIPQKRCRLSLLPTISTRSGRWKHGSCCNQEERPAWRTCRFNDYW